MEQQMMHSASRVHSTHCQSLKEGKGRKIYIPCTFIFGFMGSRNARTGDGSGPQNECVYVHMALTTLLPNLAPECPHCVITVENSLTRPLSRASLWANGVTLNHTAAMHWMLLSGTQWATHCVTGLLVLRRRPNVMTMVWLLLAVPVHYNGRSCGKLV